MQQNFIILEKNLQDSLLINVARELLY